MSSKKAPNASKGRRYTEQEKAEILAFVDQVNAEKGRGGQSAASKKYKISPLTISSWLRGGPGAPAAAKTAAPSRGRGRQAAAGGSAGGSIDKKLAKLQTLHGQIARAEKELSKLRAQFDSLKSSL